MGKYEHRTIVFSEPPERPVLAEEPGQVRAITSQELVREQIGQEEIEDSQAVDNEYERNLAATGLTQGKLEELAAKFLTGSITPEEVALLADSATNNQLYGSRLRRSRRTI